MPETRDIANHMYQDMRRAKILRRDWMLGRCQNNLRLRHCQGKVIKTAYSHKTTTTTRTTVFSERELTFTFAICCRPSVCLSVCRLSVGNARAPYSGDCNFRQYFYGIRYLGHPLASTENFTEIVPGEPLRRRS